MIKCSILDTLTDSQADTVGRLSVQAVASFHESHERLPDQAELGRIVTLITRAVIAPDAPSYTLQ